MALDPLADLPTSDTLATPSSPTTNRPLFIILGIILLIPAALCWLSTLLIPSLQTLLLSQEKTNLISDKATSVGMANFTMLFSNPAFNSALTFSSVIAFERLA